MKNYFTLVIGIYFILISCKSMERRYTINEAYYNIYKIDSINNYYLIYAKKQDSIYKIVSEKQKISNCKKIALQGNYNLRLRSFSSIAPIINSIKIYSPDIDCYYFEEDTDICLERDKGIFELYYCDNLKGLCPDTR
ncbi:hypothetical protein [Flavobacterium sp. C4GT6]|uniref:hypothetical protein n=1 Tax=Flavobacterium sp. C4GT6 TaxID=3103818 RepID=UPI002ED33215